MQECFHFHRFQVGRGEMSVKNRVVNITRMTLCNRYKHTYGIILLLLFCTLSNDNQCVTAETTDTESETGHSHSEEGVSQKSKEGSLGYVYRNTRPSQNGFKVEWDPNGYLFFCLAMGRIGNQMEHFLGSLAFAKTVNRTLVLPPLRTYRNVRFTEWFQFEPLLDYHRVILAEDFMDILAPTYWPPGEHTGYCFRVGTKHTYNCTLKQGYPWEPFWNGLGVDFDRYDWLDYSYSSPDLFIESYPGDKYPVLALRGAPAPYPMKPEHWPLQQYLKFSDRIESDAQKYIDDNFPEEKFVGIHLRNGIDWENACKNAQMLHSYMASPQCLHGTSDMVTKSLCYPASGDVLRLVKDVMLLTKAKVLFVATDKNPMKEELSNHLKDLDVKVYHLDPHLPIVDQAILIKSDYFIGNCVSSFSSFVTRARRVEDKPTAFFGYD